MINKMKRIYTFINEQFPVLRSENFLIFQENLCGRPKYI